MLGLPIVFFCGVKGSEEEKSSIDVQLYTERSPCNFLAQPMVKSLTLLSEFPNDVGICKQKLA